ncbi:hypothetical protein J6590_006802 [Homalodisca vitripennis]|nr:hypothetical protein J6590_006802 [Homalodisca vitripennis]
MEVLTKLGFYIGGIDVLHGMSQGCSQGYAQCLQTVASRKRFRGTGLFFVVVSWDSFSDNAMNYIPPGCGLKTLVIVFKLIEACYT